MSEPENEYQEALTVLNRYYTVLAEKAASEIIEHRGEFESPGFGAQADDIIEKHARQFRDLSAVYGILRWKSRKGKPEGRVPLAKDEFRCFSCGGVIPSNQERCSACGWTWRS